MTAWDMWDSVPKVLLKLLSQPQALSPKSISLLDLLLAATAAVASSGQPHCTGQAPALELLPRDSLALAGAQAAPGLSCFPCF